MRELVRRNYSITGPSIVTGNALDARTYISHVAGCDTFVHLVGVSHPHPWKKNLFRSVDYVSAHEAIVAAKRSGIKHFVYISVAHPAPIMREYIEVRKECEKIIIDSGIPATIIRPWYVIGPGHSWPLLISPVYKILEAIPSTRAAARRLGLVTLRQMEDTLLHAIESPARQLKIYGVEEIKAVGKLISE